MVLWRRRNSARKIEARFDALKADFQALQNDMRGLASGVGTAASDVLRTTNKTAENALESVGEWTNDNIGSLRNTVRKQPLAAIALSVSAGALVGALLSRR